MNTSYLGGEWYIDEMKTRANEAAGVPFTLPRSKYWYRNDYVPVYERVNRPVEAREAIEFFASDDQRTKVQLSDGSSSDYLPSKTLMLPVDKQNVLRSGIVAEKSNVWRCPGSNGSKRRMSWMNPMSSIRSASSSTKISTWLRSNRRWPTRSSRRPGVAIRISAPFFS